MLMREPSIQRNRLPLTNQFPRLTCIVITFSILAPLATSFFVVNSLIGIENIKRHYWFTDGLFISAVLNGVLFAPLLFLKIRQFAFPYSIFAAIVATFLAYYAYWLWTIGLIGV